MTHFSTFIKFPSFSILLIAFPSSYPLTPSSQTRLVLKPDHPDLDLCCRQHLSPIRSNYARYTPAVVLSPSPPPSPLSLVFICFSFPSSYTSSAFSFRPLPSFRCPSLLPHPPVFPPPLIHTPPLHPVKRNNQLLKMLTHPLEIQEFSAFNANLLKTNLPIFNNGNGNGNSIYCSISVQFVGIFPCYSSSL